MVFYKIISDDILSLTSLEIFTIVKMVYYLYFMSNDISHNFKNFYNVHIIKYTILCSTNAIEFLHSILFIYFSLFSLSSSFSLPSFLLSLIPDYQWSACLKVRLWKIRNEKSILFIWRVWYMQRNNDNMI